MSLFRAVDSIPSPAAHAVGIGSGITGLEIWAQRAQHLTAFMGLVVVALTILGGTFYAAYWCLKFYAKLQRIRARDYAE